MNKGKEKANVYSKQNKFCFDIGWDKVRYDDYLAGYNDGFIDGKNDADECIYHDWISIENELEYLGKYLVKFDNGDIDVCWLSDKHGKLNWYTHSECDIEFKTEGVKYYRTIDSL